MVFQLSSLTIFKGLISVLDIVIVYWVIYRLLVWLRGTRAFNLIKGFCIIILFFLISHVIGLTTLNWILGNFTTVLIVLVIIIFQPELRRFIEGLGAKQRLFSPLLHQSDVQSSYIIQQILKAVDTLSKEKVGALVVLENRQDLSEFVGSGIKINATISSDLLSTLFWEGSPTHDGAVIIRNRQIEAAGCFLPLTDTVISDRRLGTRHRAAMGLSEVKDAIIVVVSEETGVISLVI